MAQSRLASGRQQQYPLVPRTSGETWRRIVGANRSSAGNLSEYTMGIPGRVDWIRPDDGRTDGLLSYGLVAQQDALEWTTRRRRDVRHRSPELLRLACGGERTSGSGKV